MNATYRKLGEALKYHRHEAKESLAITSGAVEIDSSVLKDYENGNDRPASDILNLLILHFSLTDTDAQHLWGLAGYDDDISEEINMAQDKNEKADNDDNQIRINIPTNQPVLYSDMVQVMSNQYGVVLHFLQMQPNAQAQVVSRIGMSKEHAQSLLELLKRNLEDS